MRSMIMAALALTPLMAKVSEPIQRLNEATAVFSEIMGAPDKGIPQDLLENAHCIVIVPDLKTAAFVVGAKYGKGYLFCRNQKGPGWSAPATVRIEGGSVGFQIGGSSTDLIMLVMNARGADKLLESKFTCVRRSAKQVQTFSEFGTKNLSLAGQPVAKQARGCPETLHDQPNRETAWPFLYPGLALGAGPNSGIKI